MCWGRVLTELDHTRTLPDARCRSPMDARRTCQGAPSLVPAAPSDPPTWAFEHLAVEFEHPEFGPNPVGRKPRELSNSFDPAWSPTACRVEYPNAGTSRVGRPHAPRIAGWLMVRIAVRPARHEFRHLIGSRHANRRKLTKEAMAPRAHRARDRSGNRTDGSRECGRMPARVERSGTPPGLHHHRRVAQGGDQSIPQEESPSGRSCTGLYLCHDEAAVDDSRKGAAGARSGRTDRDRRRGPRPWCRGSRGGPARRTVDSVGSARHDRDSPVHEPAGRIDRDVLAVSRCGTCAHHGDRGVAAQGVPAVSPRKPTDRTARVNRGRRGARARGRRPGSAFHVPNRSRLPQGEHRRGGSHPRAPPFQRLVPVVGGGLVRPPAVPWSSRQPFPRRAARRATARERRRHRPVPQSASPRLGLRARRASSTPHERIVPRPARRRGHLLQQRVRAARTAPPQSPMTLMRLLDAGAVRVRPGRAPVGRRRPDRQESTRFEAHGRTRAL